ncbi:MULTISPECIES: DUF4760 domain-containing protein [unclassified Thalassospira]|uniref:DUF4760 domain-containing protein n=1 Tax=unclassified Thalassospira TaxID=2648997 RepID=UPI000A1D88E3|nr:DUF4760 domain-containing protein [Thalassospira sp. MCCC 1A01428]OSQ41439.1 hypothetical protein THS27_19225 [Thalassospira sp. MCCC 1A01428]
MDISTDLIIPVISAIVDWSKNLLPQQAVLITGALATTGWIFSASLTRKLSRKQHTMSALLDDAEFRKGAAIIRDYVKQNRYPIPENDEYKNWQSGMRACLNHYEFLCSGILRRDFDEKLIRINERYNLITIYSYAYSYIQSLRAEKPHGDQTVDRQNLYRSLEKVARRWAPPWTR